FEIANLATGQYNCAINVGGFPRGGDHERKPTMPGPMPASVRLSSARTSPTHFKEGTMKRISILTLVLCTCLGLAAWPQTPAKHKITKFNVPGAGTGSGQGTEGVGLVDDGSIMGWYFDSNSVPHGYLRTPGGKFTKFDPPGSQGTEPLGMNSALAITGYYKDT